jgi:predicted metal-dependent hydrolase
MSDLAAFIELFNRGEYWESHERLEIPWRENHSGFYKGLILFASAFVHAGRGNAHGVIAQLKKADAELLPYRPAHDGIDVEAVLAHSALCREIVVRNRAAAPEALAEMIPHMKLRIEPTP